MPWKPRKRFSKEAVATLARGNKMSSAQRPKITYHVFRSKEIISDLLSKLNKQLRVHIFKIVFEK